MSIVPLNTGSAPNDGTGQDLRTGGQVINANFAELDQRTAAAQLAADGAQAKADAAIPGSQKGQPNGVAGLDAGGTVPASQLPSYVDDVLEFDSFAALPATGETGKIYITKDTNSQYRWSGTQYVLLTASPGSTDAVPEGSVNKYWTLARTLGSVLTGLVTTNPAVISATDTILSGMGKLQRQVSDAVSALGNKASSGVNGDILRLTAIDSTGYLALGSGLPVATGATSLAAGTKGQVPAPPQLGSNPKFLADDMTFKEAAGGGLAVGSLTQWKYSRATIPGGQLPCDGQIVTNGRTLYPDLWALIQPFCVTDAVWLAAPYTSRGMFSLGNGTTDFRMPDDNARHPDGNTISAMVFRGDGKNSAGTPGLHQADQVQGMKHKTAIGTGASGGSNYNPIFGADTATLTNLGAPGSIMNGLYPIYTGGVVTDGSNGAPRVGIETRAASTTGIWCIVAAKTAVNPGTVDVTVLSNTVNQQGVTLGQNAAAISDLQSKQIVTKKWTSADLAWTNGGTLNLTHTLGSLWSFAVIKLKYKQAINGMAVGELSQVSSILTTVSGTGNFGAEIRRPTTTTATLQIASNGMFSASASGAANTVTPAQVDIVVELYA